MRKAAYKFGYAVGLIGTYFLVIIASPVLAAIVCIEKWRDLDLSNVEFLSPKRRCKKD